MSSPPPPAARGRSALAAVVLAADFAAYKHRAQTRKDAARTPYITHPLRVAAILAEEAGVDDDIVLQAAILHDTGRQAGRERERERDVEQGEGRRALEGTGRGVDGGESLRERHKRRTRELRERNERAAREERESCERATAQQRTLASRHGHGRLDMDMGGVKAWTWAASRHGRRQHMGGVTAWTWAARHEGRGR